MNSTSPTSIPTLRERAAAYVAQYPATYWYMWLGTFVNRLGGFVVPFLAIYLTEVRGMTLPEAGVVVSAYGAGTILAGPIGGLLADRIGRRHTMIATLVLSSVLMIALSQARTATALVVTAALLGFVTDAFRPAVIALVADVVPPEQRLRAYGLLHWVINLGYSVAPVIAGLMAKRNFQALFWADAATTLLFAGVVFWKIPETRPAEAAAEPRSRNPFAGITIAFRDAVFLPFAFLAFLVTMLFFQYQVALPVEMRADGISPELYGMVVALNGVLIVLFQPTITRLAAPYRRSRLMALAALLTGVGFGLFGIADRVELYLLGVAVWTLGEILQSPVVSTFVADIAPPAARGRYQGAFYMSWGLALFVAPLLGANALERVGSHAFWAGCLAIGVIAALGHLAIAPARTRRLEALGHRSRGD